MKSELSQLDIVELRLRAAREYLKEFIDIAQKVLKTGARTETENEVMSHFESVIKDPAHGLCVGIAKRTRERGLTHPEFPYDNGFDLMIWLSFSNDCPVENGDLSLHRAIKNKYSAEWLPKRTEFAKKMVDAIDKHLTHLGISV